MKRTISGTIIISSQLLIMIFFVFTVFSGDFKFEKKVSTVENSNLNKIATSVSLLFEDQNEIELVPSLDDNVAFELPTIDKIENVTPVIKEEPKVEEKPNYLFSIDASKYVSNEDMGFKVTENNRQYELSEYEFNVVTAVVAGEFDKNLNDALGVVSVILNRCDNTTWKNWAGESPYSQVIARGQFEVYFSDYYLAYMPGGSKYGDEKYNIAKQALLDGLNGIRNNSFTGFRAWGIASYSDKYIVYGGNRYGYN